jgi:hypothetical protein
MSNIKTYASNNAEVQAVVDFYNSSNHPALLSILDLSNLFIYVVVFGALLWVLLYLINKALLPIKVNGIIIFILVLMIMVPSTIFVHYKARQLNNETYVNKDVVIESNYFKNLPDEYKTKMRDFLLKTNKDSGEFEANLKITALLTKMYEFHKERTNQVTDDNNNTKNQDHYLENLKNKIKEAK